MKKAIKRTAQKSNRKLQEIMGRMEVNLMLPIAEIFVATQWHIEQLAGAGGMKIIHPSPASSDNATGLEGAGDLARMLEGIPRMLEGIH